MITALLAATFIAIVLVTEVAPPALAATVHAARRLARTWRAFRQFQQLLSTPLGQAFVRGLRDHVAGVEQRLNFDQWEQQMQGGSNGGWRHIATGVTHGTRYAYEEHGCRCWQCLAARAASDRKYYKGKAAS